MVDRSRRRLFKATVVSGSSMVIGGSVTKIAAHQAAATDHLRPEISETIEFLSSIYSLEALIGRLYAAWKITLFVFMNKEKIPIGNRDALNAYVKNNNITLDAAETFSVISALRNDDLRVGTRNSIIQDKERANAAADRVEHLVHRIFYETNSNEVVATTIASLHHYERIVVTNDAASAEGKQPWICRFFPFSYFCSD